MGLLDSVKGFIGMNDDDYDYDDYDYEDAADEEFEQESKSGFSRKSSPKVVPMTRTGQSRIIIMKPSNFDDSRDVSDELKARRPVIFDVGSLTTDEARRIVDFVAGTVYGLGGSIERVSGGIFVAVPANIDISGEVLRAQARGSVPSWNM